MSTEIDTLDHKQLFSHHFNGWRVLPRNRCAMLVACSLPPKVQARPIAAKNLKGDITNSELEQAGMICHLDVMPWENQAMHLDDSLVEMS